MDQLGVSRGWIGPLLFGALILLTILGVSLVELVRSYFFAEEINVERFGVFASIVTALIAGFLLAWRNMVLGKQTEVQDQSRLIQDKTRQLQDQALFNDKINAASEDLAARRQVTRALHVGTENEAVVTEWQDDLVTRAAAIDRLHGLAQERPEVVPRIARQLSIYVRELSREYPAKKLPNNLRAEELRNWGYGLNPTRPAMEMAVQVLGRLPMISNHGLKSGDVDLRGSNLQGFELNRLLFENADFSRAALHGANFHDTRFLATSFSYARCEGADFSFSTIEGGDFSSVQTSGIDLSFARIKSLEIRFADFMGADLAYLKLNKVLLSNVHFDASSDLDQMQVSKCALEEVDHSSAACLEDHWSDFFADGTTLLSENQNRPAHWDSTELDYLAFRDSWKAWRETLPQND
jgi:hypothetical protein